MKKKGTVRRMWGTLPIGVRSTDDRGGPVPVQVNDENEFPDDSTTIYRESAPRTDAEMTAAAEGEYKRIPIFVNNRDRLTVLQALLEWLRSAGYANIFVIDNDSTYPPLLDYYERLTSNLEVMLIRLETNMGPRALWTAGLLSKLHIKTPFVYTDSDVVPIDDCPSDVLDHLQKLLALYPNCHKIGLGLKIDDLPDHYEYKLEVALWESQYWESKVGDGLFSADVDTTFALYRSPGADPCFALSPALRTGHPYVARHLPWYLDSENPTEEDRYYARHCMPGASHWSAGAIPRELTRVVIERLVAKLAEKEAKLAEKEAELASVAETLDITTRIVESIKLHPRAARVMPGTLYRLSQKYGLRTAVEKAWRLFREQGMSGAIRKVMSKNNSS